MRFIDGDALDVLQLDIYWAGGLSEVLKIADRVAVGGLRLIMVDEALASNEIAANWIRNNVLELKKGMPEVMAGSVLVAEVKLQSLL